MRNEADHRTRLSSSPCCRDRHRRCTNAPAPGSVGSGRPAVGSSHGEGCVIIPDIHSAYLQASKGSLEKSGL